MEGAEPGRVRRGHAALDGEEHPGLLAVDEAAHLVQHRQSHRLRQVVFHFVKAHASVAGQQLPTGADLLRGRGAAQHPVEQPAAQARRPGQGVAQPQQLVQVGVVIRHVLGHVGRIGFVVTQRQDMVTAGDHEELEVAVLPPQGRGLLQHVLKAPHHAPAVQLVGRAQVHIGAEHHTQCTHRHLPGCQALRPASCIGLAELTIRGHQCQAADLAGQARKTAARAVRGGGGGAGQGLDIDVAEVAKRQAMGLQRAGQGVERGPGVQPRAHFAVDGRQWLDQRHGQVIQRDQRAVGGIERCEGMPCPAHPHRPGAAEHGSAQFVQVTREDLRRRLGADAAGPVLPFGCGVCFGQAWWPWECNHRLHRLRRWVSARLRHRSVLVQAERKPRRGRSRAVSIQSVSICVICGCISLLHFHHQLIRRPVLERDRRHADHAGG